MEVLIRKSSLNSGCLIASFDYQTVSIPKMSVLFLNCFWQRAARHQSVVTTRRSQCTLLGIEAWALSQLTFKQFNSPTSPTEPQLDPNDAVSKKFARIWERDREIILAPLKCCKPHSLSFSFFLTRWSVKADDEHEAKAHVWPCALPDPRQLVQ